MQERHILETRRRMPPRRGYEAEAEEKTSEMVIQKIFDELPVP